jgi:hypothetical protein
MGPAAASRTTASARKGSLSGTAAREAQKGAPDRRRAYQLFQAAAHTIKPSVVAKMSIGAHGTSSLDAHASINFD